MKSIGRFRFSLETVLKVRRLREEQTRLDLSMALQRLARSRQALSDTEHSYKKRLAELQHAAAKGWTAKEHQIFTGYLDHLKMAIQGWRERISQEKEEVERKKQTLIHLHQEHRLLSRLREKRYAQFLREFNKVWEKETEAIALGRWPVMGKNC